MEPPQIVKYRTKRARLTNRERREINEYGLNVPSKNTKNYEPNVTSTTMLLSSGNLPGSRQFNYKVKATANRNNSWERYLRERANAKVRANNKTKKNRNRNRNNNGTRRTLF